MQNFVNLPIIGYVRSPLTQKFGVPRQSNLVNISAVLEFLPPFCHSDAFVGLDGFSHLWVIWQFHHNHPQTNFRPQVRPPRLGGNDKLGVFATRSMYRPANLGLSVVAIEKIIIHHQQVKIQIGGADMIDGTPIIDIKPYLRYSDSLPSAISGFADELPATKLVIFHPSAQQQAKDLQQHHILTQKDVQTIQQLIAQDPRPAYRQAEKFCHFVMRYKKVDVVFYLDELQRLCIKDLILA